MDHIVVRPAQPGDGRDLARGYLQSCRYYAQLDPEAFQVPTTDGLIEWMEASLQRPRSQDNLWLVAEVDGRVVGNVEARLERPVADAARQRLRELGQVRVWVNLLDVDESCRRRGVATRLMHEVEQWGRANGATLVALDTYVGSPLSVPFYEERMGYRRQAVIYRKALR
jgi:GNAT superfamily N-acetyltransferase